MPQERLQGIFVRAIIVGMDKPKRGPGRPPIDDPATERLEFRLTPEALERYERAAKRAGKALSAWIKAVCDRASRR
jgi:hypothetical protein